MPRSEAARKFSGAAPEAGAYFLCCRCYQLAYASQRENPNDRALRRANNIRIRLGGEPDLATLFPEAFEGISSPPIEPIGMTC